MVLKRLKLHQFFLAWHEIFPTHKHECQEWGTNLKIAAKDCLLSLQWWKPNFTIFLP